MSDIPQDLVSIIAGKLRADFRMATPDALQEDAMLDAEEAGFDGDYDALWEAIKAQLLAPPPEPAQRGGRGRQSDREDKPFVPRPWTDADAENVTAPFRFADLSENVALLANDVDAGGMIPRNQPQAETFSAVLDVTWEVETPILIGDSGASDEDNAPVLPFKLCNDWALPGATLRGLIRSSLETIAFGRLFQTNRHRRFALRDFDHPAYRDFVKASVADLKAGWLRKTDTGATITPCEWGYLRIEDIVGSSDDRDVGDWINKDRKEKYKGTDWTGRDAFTATTGYGTGEKDKSNRLIYKAGGNKPGVPIYSGRVPGGGRNRPNKRFEYVFFDSKNAAPVEVAPAVWESFVSLHSKPSKNKSEPHGAWEDLSKAFHARGRVPVFFMGELQNNGADPEFSFGLTRLYRRPHSYSVGDILAKNKAHLPAKEKITDGEATLELQPEFVEHLFGFVYEPDELEFGQSAVINQDTYKYTAPSSIARKGRVAFGFARAASDGDFSLWPEKPISTVMGTPNAGYAPFYLVGEEKDYSSDTARLAGRKRFIARHDRGDPKAALEARLEAQLATAEIRRNTKVQSRLQFLAPEKGAAFKGRIKLHNVTEPEIGAILWALTFGGSDSARHLIGRGKAFGAGQCKVAHIDVHTRPSMGGAPATVHWSHGAGREKIGEWVDAFEGRIRSLARLPGGTAFSELPPVKALLAIATPRGWDAPGTDYLPYSKDGEKGQARRFQDLRKKTGMGAGKVQGRKAPKRLLSR